MDKDERVNLQEFREAVVSLYGRQGLPVPAGFRVLWGDVDVPAPGESVTKDPLEPVFTPLVPRLFGWTEDDDEAFRRACRGERT